MGILDSFKSACRAVGQAVSDTWAAAKRHAGEAISWMAEKAEGFVDGVKNVWQVVKPFVDHIRAGLLAAADIVKIPWLKAALIGLEKVVGALVAFENSPIAKKVDEAIKWAIKLAQRWQASRTAQAADEVLNEEEMNQARRHQETFRFAEREVVPEDERHQLELAAAINDFEIAKADVSKAIEAAPTDFEHYLRLRATQKLLKMADQKFRAATSIDELTADDLFLVRIASDLIKQNPELTQEAAVRLDRLLKARFGKALEPFVFEELVASWAKRSEVLENQWTMNNRAHAKEAMLFKSLSLAKEIQNQLSDEEAAALSELTVKVPAMKRELDALAQTQRDIQRYVGAAEGFLQLLEKEPAQLEAEDRDFLLEDGPRVGKLLIACAERSTPFDQLDSEDQALVTDFANVFRQDSKNRMQQILEVTV